MLSFSNLSQSRDNVRENGMWMSCLSLVKRQVCHINVALLDSSMKETVYVVQLRDSVYLLSTIFVFWAFLQFIQCIRPSRRYFRQAVVVLYSLKNSRYGVRVLKKFTPGLDRPLHVFTSCAWSITFNYYLKMCCATTLNHIIHDKDEQRRWFRYKGLLAGCSWVIKQTGSL